MKPTLEEIKYNMDKTLVRLSEGTICGLKQFEYKNDKKYIGVVSSPYWHNNFSVNTTHIVELDKAYNRNCFVSDFNIDAIAFLNNKSEVSDAIEFGCDEDIAWDWDINNPQCDDQLDAYKYWLSARNMNKSQRLETFRKAFFEGVDNMNNILEIYEEKQSRKINKKYDELEQSIKLTDERYKTWLDCTTTLTNLYKEDKVLTTEEFAPIQLSKDTLAKLHTLYYSREEDLCKLCEKRREVQSQLDMCDTYDQKQEILRRYNIINKNGKVNG